MDKDDPYEDGSGKRYQQAQHLGEIGISQKSLLMIYQSQAST